MSTSGKSAQDDKWKQKLLSSSYPLEHEVGNIFVQNDFYVSAEYTYSRIGENGQSKDFSIDCLGSHFLGMNEAGFDERNCQVTISCPTEVKYRHPSSYWFFLRDPNTELFEPTLGSALNEIDTFSEVELLHKANCEFEKDIELCYKATEIHGSEVYNKDIKHAIEQVRYSMPFMLTNDLHAKAFNSHYNRKQVLVTCPIIVTTAKLLVGPDDFSIDTVNHCQAVSNLGEEVPYLIYYSPTPPDFMRHCTSVFQNQFANGGGEQFSAIRKYLEDLSTSQSSIFTGIGVFSALMFGASEIAGRYFSQFYVCNIEHLDGFLKTIKQVIKKDAPMLNNAVQGGE